MSQLTIQPFTLPAANLGGENPLAPLRPYETASATGIPIQRGEGNYPDRGDEASILPYRLQDQYDRNLQPHTFTSAVLENERLRASFVLELGGRMWSLFDKRAGRELLSSNSVFQPANFAVRDAWFTGGVEWNIGIIGHCPLTCSPLFAARVEGDDGEPVLRLYEFERIRRVVFQVDCWLPDGSPFLRVRVRIQNPNRHAVPMYWWSNIGVPEREDVRVLGPAERAQRHDYDGSLLWQDVPLLDGIDVTYTTNRRAAADMYFAIPQGRRPWIAALDGEGCGLVHASTDRLRGRKMFNIGVHRGGRRWQEFLAQPGIAYLEIQGGLAPTQSQYVTMPAGATWEWLEAYGPLQADAGAVHGKDWTGAYEAVETALGRVLPQDQLETELSRTSAMADRAPAELLHCGAGWGALENRRRRAAGEPPFASDALPFPDESMDGDQAPWLALLERGTLPPRAASDDPGSLMVQPEWRELLETSINRPGGSHWLSWYHVAVMRFRAGNINAARGAWAQSLALEPTPWARRDLAVLAREAGDHAGAANQWIAAARMAPDVAPLAIECCQALMRGARFADLIRFAASLPPAVRSHGRIRLLHAMASLEVDDLDTVARYFGGDLDIANIREKEMILSDLWFGWHAKRMAKEHGVEVTDDLRELVRNEFPPPIKFDFRLVE